MSTLPAGPPIVLLPPQPMGSVEMGWTAEQRDALVAAMDAHGDDWDAVAAQVEGKSRLEVEIFASEVIRRMGRSLVEAFKLRCMQAPRPLQLGRLYRAEMDARLRDEIAHILTKAEEAMYHDLTSRQPKRRKHNGAQPPASASAPVDHVDNRATAATLPTGAAATTAATAAQPPIAAVPPPRATVAQSPPLPPHTASHTSTTSTSAAHTDAVDTTTAITTVLDAHATCGGAQESPFHGVSWNEERSKWAAHLDHCCLGYYEEEYGAAIGYDIAAREQGPPASDHLNFDDDGNCLVDHPAFPSRARTALSRAVLSRQQRATDAPCQLNIAPSPPVKEDHDPLSKKRRRVAPLHMVFPAAGTPAAAAAADGHRSGGGGGGGGASATSAAVATSSTGGDGASSSGADTSSSSANGGGSGGGRRGANACSSRAGGTACGIVQTSRNAADEGAPNPHLATPGNEGPAGGSTKRTSIYRGVIWHRASDKWQARIKENKIHKNLGFFADEKEAALAYDRAARERWGDTAKPNFDGDGQPTHVRQNLQNAREAAPPPTTTAFMGSLLSAVEAPPESTEMAMDGMMGTRTHTDTPHTDTEESQADVDIPTHGVTQEGAHVRVHTTDVQWQQQQQQQRHHSQAQVFKVPHTSRPPGSTTDPWSDADVVQIMDQLITTSK